VHPGVRDGDRAREPVVPGIDRRDASVRQLAVIENQSDEFTATIELADWRGNWSAFRLAAVRGLIDRGASFVVGDLADLAETRGVADQVNRLGQMDAVIHNAGVNSGPLILPVNVVAPYLPLGCRGVSRRPRRAYWAV
jgi:NAD(P)-dependent dehydrogenase (short-subunit alcohol dehydrogenase family)